MNIIKLISNPNGRINRLQFVGGYLTTLCLVILLYIVPIAILLFMYSSSGPAGASDATEVGAQAAAAPLAHTHSWIALLFFIPGTILLLYSFLCLTFKRLQDTGLPSWLIILFLVPWVNVFLLLFLMLFPTRDQR